MKIFRGAAAFAAARPADAPRTAVAIGNFDGVHLGHQALIAEARARARAPDAAVALTFMPHPARVLAPAKAPPLIMPLDRRLALLAEAGADVAVVQPFTPAFAAVEAQRLRRGRAGARPRRGGRGGRLRLHASGADAPATSQRLQEWGAALGVSVAGHSSGHRRRRALFVDACPRAGRRPATCGAPRRCSAARSKWRAWSCAARRAAAPWGFPPPTSAPETELAPRLGIYAARARICDGPTAAGASASWRRVSIGRNPTFEADGAPVTVEAHLLDFAGDLYGRRLRLELVEWLRDEQRFASVDALVAQIAADVARVRALMS